MQGVSYMVDAQGTKLGFSNPDDAMQTITQRGAGANVGAGLLIGALIGLELA